MAEYTINLSEDSNEDTFDFFVQGGYDSLDVDSNKVIKINMPPQLVISLVNPTVQTTFGQRVEVGISVYVDSEDDPIRFEVSNDKNYKLNFYPVLFGEVSGVRVYKMRSDVLKENYNAVLGTSTVSVSWVDATTEARVTETFEVEILSEYAYFNGVIKGTVETESSTLNFLVNARNFLEE